MKLALGRMPPSDGIDKFHFPQGSVVIHGGNFEKLIENIFEYRLRNNLPLSDIEREVHDFYCSRYPSFCHPDSSDNNPVGRRNGESMLNRVSRWASATIRTMPRGGYSLVTSAVAESRAQICMACPKNGGWRGGCGGCSAATLQLLQQIKQLRKTKNDGNLSACQVGGWENGAAVHLPTIALPLSVEQHAALPEKCWRKMEP